MGVGWGEGRGWVVRQECGSEAGNKGWGPKGQVLRAKMKGARSPRAGSGVQGPGTGSESRPCPSWHVTCFSGNSMNSSVLATSTKCCSTYLWAALSRSLHECVSAKPRMPRQLEGSS